MLHGEQDEAARLLGVDSLVRLGHADGELLCDDRLRAGIVRVIRTERPQLVLGHDPTTLWQRFGLKFGIKRPEKGCKWTRFLLLVLNNSTDTLW